MDVLSFFSQSSIHCLSLTVHRFNGSRFTGSVGFDPGLLADFSQYSSAEVTLNAEPFSTLNGYIFNLLTEWLCHQAQVHRSGAECLRGLRRAARWQQTSLILLV
jgi:hypothetical protein